MNLPTNFTTLPSYGMRCNLEEVRILRDTCSSKKLSLWNSVLRYQTPNHCLMTSMLYHAPTFLSHLPSAEDTLFFR